MTVTTFCCMHATASRPMPATMVAVPCTGRLDLASLLLPFARGASGVLILRCAPHECRHRVEGEELPLADVVDRARHALSGAGISPKRLATRSAGTGEEVEELERAFSETLRPLESWRREGASLDDDSIALMGESDPVTRALRLLAAIQSQSRSVPSPRVGSLKGRPLLWPGCAVLRASLYGAVPVTVEQGLALARGAGAPHAEAAPERCCGLPLRQEGDEGAFTALARDNAAYIAATGASEVLTLCSKCARVLDEGYREAGAPLSAPVTDVATWATRGVTTPKKERSLALARGCDEGDTEAAAAAFEPVLSFRDPLFWPGCGEPLEGPALRRAVLALTGEAHARGAKGAIIPCTHCAARAQALTAGGGWTGSAKVTVESHTQALTKILS